MVKSCFVSFSLYYLLYKLQHKATYNKQIVKGTINPRLQFVITILVSISNWSKPTLNECNIIKMFNLLADEKRINRPIDKCKSASLVMFFSGKKTPYSSPFLHFTVIYTLAAPFLYRDLKRQQFK